MNDLARTWMRRIAVGAPLVFAAPLIGCGGSSNCPSEERTYSLSSDDRAAIYASGEIDPVTCRDTCGRLLQSDAPLMVPGSTGISGECDVRFDDAGTEILVCTFFAACGS